MKRLQSFLHIFRFRLAIFLIFVEWETKGEIRAKNRFRGSERSMTMNEPNRSQWETRCAFNSFCKKAIKYEASNAHRDVKQHQKREVTFSDLSGMKDENELYATDRHFAGEDADDLSFHVAGLEITPKLLFDAIRALPAEKRGVVLLYYFLEMSDAEIAQLYKIPRSTVQYRRTSSFELLKRFLEERA